MDASFAHALEQLDRSLHRDIDEDSISLIPPGAALEMLPMHEEDVQDTVKAIFCAHLLRRRINGWSDEQIRAHGASYLGLPKNVLDYLVNVMPLVVEAINKGKADLTFLLPASPARDRRLQILLVSYAKDAFRRQNITTWSWPDTSATTDTVDTPDGEIINSSFSTNAPKVKASVLRVLRHDQAMASMLKSLCIFVGIGCICLGGSLWLFITGHWFWGILTLTPIILAHRFFLMACMGLVILPTRIRQFFSSGLLTPAVIISINPLRCLCVANMSNGSGADATGVKILTLPDLSHTTTKIGQVLSCASVFTEGDAVDRWDDFDPRPIEWGTNDPIEIKRCMEKLDADDKQRLSKAYELWKKGIFSDADTSLWILDLKGTIIAHTTKKPKA